MVLSLTGHASNKACREYFCTSSTADGVAAVYGPELTMRVARVQAYWWLKVGQQPDFWKQTQPYTAAAQQITAEPPTKGKPAAAVAVAAEKACLDRAAGILQVIADLIVKH